MTSGPLVIVELGHLTVAAEMQRWKGLQKSSLSLSLSLPTVFLFSRLSDLFEDWSDVHINFKILLNPYNKDPKVHEVDQPIDQNLERSIPEA